MRKKKYIVVPRTQGAMLRGLQTGKGRLKFGKKTALWVDPDVAGEIDQQYGLKGSGEVWVERDENLEWHNHHDGNTDGRKVGIHHYTFAGSDMKNAGGNEAVWVKTVDGATKVSRAVAEELGLKILKRPKKKAKRVTT